MTDTNQLPEPELGYIHTDKSNQPAFSARQMREAMKHALRPERVPMTDEEATAMIRETGRGHTLRREGSTSLQIVRATEDYYGITAQAKKETP